MDSRTRPLRVLGIDPGLTTGWVQLLLHPAPQPVWKLSDRLELVSMGATPCDYAVEKIHGLELTVEYDMIVIEHPPRRGDAPELPELYAKLVSICKTATLRSPRPADWKPVRHIVERECSSLIRRLSSVHMRDAFCMTYLELRKRKM